MLSMDDLDDQVAEFLVALESSLRVVKIFLHLVTGATETVDLTSISDLIGLLGSYPSAADTVAKVFLQALDAITYPRRKDARVRRARVNDQRRAAKGSGAQVPASPEATFDFWSS